MSRTLTHLESNTNSRNFVSERLTLRALEIDFRTDTRWQSFVEAHPNGTIYHSPLWLDVLEKEYGHKTIALVCENGDGELRALLPLVYTKGLPLHIGGQSGARRLSSLPRTPFGGPLSLDRLASAVVLRAAIERVKHDPRLRLQVKTHEEGLDKLADGLVCKPWRLTYVLELPNRREDLLFGSSRNRNRIRWAVHKATREGVQVRAAETPEELRAWYELYLDTMRRNVVPPRPRRFFENLWNSMYAAGFMQLLLAERPLEDLGRERRAAHPEQDERVEFRARLLCELGDLADALQHPSRLVEPTEPLVLAGAGPDRRVAGPDPLDELLLRCDAQAGASCPRFDRIPSSSSSNESANFCTPSRSSVSVTSS